MNITILSDADAWMNSYTQQLVQNLERDGHSVRLINQVNALEAGDIAFFLSLGQLVPASKLNLHKNNIVVHASALPRGKGWSPLTWQIVEGYNEIPLTLFEAEAAVDSGAVYLTDILHYNGSELIDELRSIMAEHIIKMCYEFVCRYPAILTDAKSQEGESTFYKRRNKDDSRIDPHKTIAEQFNLLRTVDNERYPAFFELHGCRYILSIVKEAN